LREGDLVARLAGDEFALLLPGSDAAAALAVAERVALIFQQPLKLDDHIVDMAAGFGVACFPAHASDPDALISHAEVAMYAAKRKARVAMVYDPATDAGSALTLSLLTELRRALEHNELRLFLQPKIALGSRALVGAEALVRWQHPTRGMLPPVQFIPFAEQTGFVRQLTLWMLEATARQWLSLKAMGLQRVSVNLSTRDLLDPELPVKLQAILQRHGMPATALCLEITESAIMEEPQRAEATLNTLSAAGFKLSIDDFGTGHSSLAYLKRLPVDELKIDKSFVMAMEKDGDDAKIVRSTIDLAHNLGLTVVAEGVENGDILERLAGLSCDEAQGFHMARPMPVAEMAGFAERWLALGDGTADAAAPGTPASTPLAAVG
jgi:EAL domain-containing protein (putative c-di-GMP-specific phosphodiesterase class I)